MGDGRVADFFRRVLIRACEKIAGWAQAGADKLRRDDERGPEQRRDPPSVEALLQLGDAALAYSSARRGDGASPWSTTGRSGALDIPEMRAMGEALSRPLLAAKASPTEPGQANGPRVSAAAARGRSTTVKRNPKGPANGVEQAAHLRLGSSKQKQSRSGTST